MMEFARFIAQSAERFAGFVAMMAVFFIGITVFVYWVLDGIDNIARSWKGK
jgi:hypothetical protein